MQTHFWVYLCYYGVQVGVSVTASKIFLTNLTMSCTRSSLEVRETVNTTTASIIGHYYMREALPHYKTQPRTAYLFYSAGQATQRDENLCALVVCAERLRMRAFVFVRVYDENANNCASVYENCGSVCGHARVDG